MTAYTLPFAETENGMVNLTIPFCIRVRPSRSGDVAAQFVLDVNADDLLK